MTVQLKFWLVLASLFLFVTASTADTGAETFAMDALDNCEPDAILAFPWIQDGKFKYDQAHGLVKRCVAIGKSEGLKALIKIAPKKEAKTLFQRACHKAVSYDSPLVLEELLNSFSFTINSSLVNRAVKYLSDPNVFQLLAREHLNRFDCTELLVVTEVIKGCFKFNDTETMTEFLSTLSILPAYVIKAYEKIVIEKNFPMKEAFVKSGILHGLGKQCLWNLTPYGAKARQEYRKEVMDLLRAEDYTRFYSKMKNIEFPFLIDIIVDFLAAATTVKQQKFAKVLLDYIKPYLLDNDVVKIMKTACESNNGLTRHIVFNALHDLKSDKPLLLIALKNAHTRFLVMVFRQARVNGTTRRFMEMSTYTNLIDMTVLDGIQSQPSFLQHPSDLEDAVTDAINAKIISDALKSGYRPRPREIYNCIIHCQKLPLTGSMLIEKFSAFLSKIEIEALVSVISKNNRSFTMKALLELFRDRPPVYQ